MAVQTLPLTAATQAAHQAATQNQMTVHQEIKRKSQSGFNFNVLVIIFCQKYSIISAKKIRLCVLCGMENL